MKVIRQAGLTLLFTFIIFIFVLFPASHSSSHLGHSAVCSIGEAAEAPGGSTAQL